MNRQDDNRKKPTRKHNKYGRRLPDDPKDKKKHRVKSVLNELTESYVRRGMDFTTIERGDSYKIIFPDGGVAHGRNSRNSKGYSYGWINKKVLSDVSERVNSGVYVPRNTDNDRSQINTVLFNHKNIEDYLGVKDDVIAIDINACYITTLNRLGALSDDVFNDILSRSSGDKAYKVAMSSAVGSLGTTDIVRKYKGGRLDLNSMEIKRREYNVVRLDVVDRVWEVAQEVIRLIPDGFFMFLTDCFYVKKDCVDIVDEVLKGYGYDYTREFAYFKDFQVKANYELSKVYEVTFVKESNIKKKAEEQRDSEDSIMCFSSRNTIG